MSSAAIFKGRDCLAKAHHQARFGHSEVLIGLVQQICDTADISASALDFVIAGCGPGSFTGLRVCLAAAQGYKLAADATGIGVSVLSAQAYHAVTALENNLHDRAENKQIISFCDTRRNSYFVQKFDSELNILTEIEEVEKDKLATILAPLPSILTGPALGIDAHNLGDTWRGHNIAIHPVTLEAHMLGELCLSPKQAYSHLFLPLEPLYVQPAITVKSDKK